MSTTADRASPPGTSAEEVLLGLGNTVDYEIAWDDRTFSDLLREHGVLVEDPPVPGPLGSEAQILRSLLAHLREGTGGEHFVSSTEVLTRFAARFSTRITLGGTNVRAALAMRTLGRPSTVHLVSTNDDERRLMPAEIATISSAEGDSLDPHVIVQFPGGATVTAGGSVVIAPRSNRVILANDVPNRDLVIAEEFGDAAAKAGVILVSGFNSMQDEALLEDRMADVLRHIARRRRGAVVVYEHGAFHVPAFAERVRQVIGPAMDVWCCNEDELQEHVGREVDLLDPRDVLEATQELRSAVGAPSLVVHTRHWALAIGGPADRRRAMLFGGVACAATRYAYGDEVTEQHLRDAAGWPLQPAGAHFAASIEARGGTDVSCIAAYEVPTTTPTTIGLGDAFAGGLIAALAAMTHRALGAPGAAQARRAASSRAARLGR
jgi:ADP-dependent phosphofructokinase/glucokinase